MKKKEYPEYRQREFIGSSARTLESGKISQIIHVPTDAGIIPITEAGKNDNTRRHHHAVTEIVSGTRRISV